MTTRAVDPFEALNQTISGGIVLLGVMFLSLPVIALGLALLGVERWIARRKAPQGLPVFPGHRLIGDLPSRADLHEEIFSKDDKPLP